MKHLIDIKDFSTAELDALIGVAKDIMQHPENYAHK